MLPGANHNLGVARAPGAAWDFPRRPPEFAATLTSWLRDRVVAPKKAA
jgi:hypothetical protein